MKVYLLIIVVIALRLPVAFSENSEKKLRTFDDDKDFEISHAFPPPEKPYVEETTVTNKDVSFIDVLRNLSDTVLDKLNGVVQSIKGVFGGGKESACKEKEAEEEDVKAKEEHIPIRAERKQMRNHQKRIEEEKKEAAEEEEEEEEEFDDDEE